MAYQPITKAGVDTAEPLDFTEKKISISTQVQHRNRTFILSFEGYTIDQIADLLDKKFGPAPARKEEHTSPPALPNDGPPLCENRNCSRYHQPMSPSQHEGWYCKGKDSTTGNAKGYCKSAS